MSLDARVAELRRRLREALILLEKGDAVQSSEKLYKVAEDAIKILSAINGIPEYETAKREGGWWTRLLDRVAERLRGIYGEEILSAWSTAYRLHVEGFHEERLSKEEVLGEAWKIEDLIKIVERELRGDREAASPTP